MAFEIDLLPVGSEKKSGDCIALRFGDLENGCQNQTVIIVDGGYGCTWKDTLKPHLQKYYNCEYDGKLHIDLVVLSHPDQDHVSGLVEMANDDDVEIGAQLQESVDAPAADHPNNTTKRYMKKGRSFTPLNCALNPLIFELRDSADALVDRFTK